MAEIKIYGTLSNATSDKAIVKSEQVIGGFMPLSTTERNSLVDTLRKTGMLVYDTTESKLYVLGSNNTWAEYTQGTFDYTDLENKPQINSITLSGNKSLSDLGIQSALSTTNTLNNTYIATDSTHRWLTDTEITTWNNKQDTMSSGTGISISSNTVSLNTTGATTGQMLTKTDSGVSWSTVINAEDYTIE